MLNKAKGNTASPTLTIAVLAGAAGTGKTTLMRYILDELVGAGTEPMLLAPTGKAAARLRDLTGAQTRTVHSGLLTAPKEQRKCPSCGGWSEKLGVNPAIAERRGVNAVTCELCFRTLPTSALSGLPQRLGFAVSDEKERPMVYIVDESSMISRALMNDIEAAAPHGASILFVGDREQLQPVVGYGEPPGWGVNFDNPDAVLTEVMRQAAGNPIVQLATAIRDGRQGQRYFNWQTDPDDPRLTITFAPNYMPPVRAYFNYRAARLPDGQPDRAKNDVVMLTYTNGTRQTLNEMIRRATGRAQVAERDGTFVAMADRIVILMNKPALNLYNGEVFSVREVSYMDEAARALGLIKVTLLTPSGDKVVFTRGAALGMPPAIYKAAFQGLMDRMAEVLFFLSQELGIDDVPRTVFKYVSDDVLWSTVRTVRPVNLVQMDYGECITINKSQGSQWRNVVIVWDRSCDSIAARQGVDTGKRYAYTALTRASQTANIFLVDQYGGRDRFDELKSGKLKPPPWVFDAPPPMGPGAIRRLLDVAGDAIRRGLAEGGDD
jgi:ATP-dependent exoDNAse (exonuclease V) alpha subunit